MTFLRQHSPQALYPGSYIWLVFLSAMDIMMTTAVVYSGGQEANRVADYFMNRFDTVGLAVYKFAILAFFVGICEILGRRNLVAGRRLATTAIFINLVPILLAFAILFRIFWPGA